MPMGSQHTVTGLLLTDHKRPVVEVDGGGTWRLEIDHDARRFLGRRVTIEGIRVSFDVLDVTSVRPAGTPAPVRLSWWRWLIG